MVAASQLRELAATFRKHLGSNQAVMKLCRDLTRITAYEKNKSFRETIDALIVQIKQENGNMH